MTERAMYSARDVSFRYPGGDRDAVAGAHLDIARGEFVALLGPNGSGKSTLLRLLLGALVPRAGTIAYDGRAVRDWPRDRFAREVGVVTQSEELAFVLTVRELVAMGRYPHLGAWRNERDEGRAAIEHALARCAVSDLAERSVLELSGGERQRARLARALAQEPRTLVLDEPTASLDIAHEMTLFEMLAALAHDGVTIIVVTHNLNLAARYAQRLVLLDRGHIVAAGAPADVLTQPNIESVYHWPVTVAPHHGSGPDHGTPQIVPLRLQHEGNTS
jgi:iron complex transport system ATP-binding protein